jgi:hypothetical protein
VYVAVLAVAAAATFIRRDPWPSPHTGRRARGCACGTALNALGQHDAQCATYFVIEADAGRRDQGLVRQAPPGVNVRGSLGV